MRARSNWGGRHSNVADQILKLQTGRTYFYGKLKGTSVAFMIFWAGVWGHFWW
ncbi:hypothetical protein GE21DRAFT_1283298 [Neurospora crassa]|nr:hypothetical protein GE21DRAFT_1283298 [Neurospora crassa]